MKASLFFRIVVTWSFGQARPPTTEQLGRDPGALRQEAAQAIAYLEMQIREWILFGAGMDSDIVFV